jgi:hypothetical protein
VRNNVTHLDNKRKKVHKALALRDGDEVSHISVAILQEDIAGFGMRNCTTSSIVCAAGILPAGRALDKLEVVAKRCMHACLCAELAANYQRATGRQASTAAMQHQASMCCWLPACLRCCMLRTTLAPSSQQSIAAHELSPIFQNQAVALCTVCRHRCRCCFLRFQIVNIAFSEVGGKKEQQLLVATKYGVEVSAPANGTAAAAAATAPAAPAPACLPVSIACNHLSCSTQCMLNARLQHQVWGRGGALLHCSWPCLQMSLQATGTYDTCTVLADSRWNTAHADVHARHHLGSNSFHGTVVFWRSLGRSWRLWWTV